jgi:hypothetical protein
MGGGRCPENRLAGGCGWPRQARDDVDVGEAATAGPARGVLGPPKFVQFGAPIIVAARRFPPPWSVIYY